MKSCNCRINILIKFLIILATFISLHQTSFAKEAVADIFILKSGEIVKGLDGITIEAPEGSIEGELAITVERFDENSLPVGIYLNAEPLSSYYRFSSEKNISSKSKPFLIGIPINDALLSQDKELEILRYVPSNRLIPTVTSEEQYNRLKGKRPSPIWAHAFGREDRLDKKTSTILINKNSFSSDGYIIVPVAIKCKSHDLI